MRLPSKRGGGIESFKLVGPRPCCPGKKETMLLAGSTANFLVESGIPRYRRISSEELHVPFTVIPEKNHGCEFEWFHLSPPTAKGRCDSATVFIRPGALKPPLRRVHGILDTTKGGSFDLVVNAGQSITPQEIMRGLKSGKLTKTFTLQKRLDLPGSPEFRTTQGTVTVKVEFGEQEDEIWLLRITASEKRSEKQSLTIRTPKGNYLKLLVGVQYDWDIAARLVISRSKQTWRYKEGRVTAAGLIRKVIFKRDDLCECYIHKCKTNPAEDAAWLIDGFLSGRRVGGGVRLDWHEFKYRAEACVVCLPLGVYMPKRVYRHRFKAGDLLGLLSKKVIPLKNGYQGRGSLGKGLKYRITMQREK